MTSFVRKLTVIAASLAAFSPSLAIAGDPLDRFQCEIRVQGILGEPVQSISKLSAARTVETIDGMVYENPGDSLQSSLQLANGFRVELWAQYTFKRAAMDGSPWAVHTCMSGSVTNIFGVKSSWFCPNLYFPVSEKDGVPQFDGINGGTIDHDFELEGEKVHLSCTLLETISP